jgi:hypothetical protein
MKSSKRIAKAEVIKSEGIEIEITNEMRPGYVDDSELWETGKLGATEKFVGVAPRRFGEAIDHSLGLQPISIRLQKDMIEALKTLAQEQGLGYQPYLRQILTRHVADAMAARKAKL